MTDAGVERDENMAALDLGRSTYYKWLALYRRADSVADILGVGVSTGAPMKLTDAQERKLRSWIVGRDPRQFQRNEDAVRRWRSEEFPAIRERARKVGADLYFCDEAAVRTDHHSGTT
jgi:transposase